MNIFKVAVSALILTSTSVLAANNFHMGAKVAGTYNMFWNTDVTIGASSFGIDAAGFDEEMGDANVKVKGLEKADGMGVDFGLTFMLSITNNFALAPELLFSYRTRSTDLTFSAGDEGKTTSTYYDNGYSYSYSYEYEDDDESMGLNDIELKQWYFEIPVMFRFTTDAGVFLGAGPVISLNMDTEGKASIVSMDIDDYTTTFIMGIAADLGYTLTIKDNQKLDFSLRFQMGLTSIVSDEIEIPYDEFNAKIDGTKIADPKDMIISFGIGYWFL
ncbi:MAG: outer membrane beta-barrel protein [Fibrobacter sp.]|nr:outer membrane beta-barrel protein [Fibrobacter sp.]